MNYFIKVCNASALPHFTAGLHQSMKLVNSFSSTLNPHSSIMQTHSYQTFFSEPQAYAEVPAAKSTDAKLLT